MKKMILSVALLATMSFVSCKDQVKNEGEEISTETTKEEVAMTNISFGVRGNCGMCKETIEEAVNAVGGVTAANWDKDKKKIDVSFDGSQTNEMAIHNAIAASGYDTEKVAGNEEAYNNLPGCCQYDHDMMMNQSGEMKAEDHSNHNH